MANQLLPKIETADDALKASRQGAIAGGIVAAMEVAGVVFAQFFGTSPSDRSAVTPEQLFEWYLGTAVVVPIILFCSWRLWVGKGYVSGALLLLLFVLEIGAKVVGGTAGVGWWLFYGFLALALISGVRGAWAGRAFRSPPAVG